MSGLRALDAGASTGGFTDCLLQRGAAHVVALDVGHGQLHERLRADPRVTNLERCNIRHATVEQIGGPVDIVVGDLSFISLRVVIPSLVALCQPGRPMVLLVKPQFEAGRAEVSKGKGVITDPEIRQRVRDEVGAALVDAGCDVVGWTESPLRGADGNVEYLVHAVTPPGTRHRERRDHRRHWRSSPTTNASWRASWPTKATAWCAARDVDVWMPTIDADAIGAADLASERPIAEAQLVLSLGGDGTMLRSVRLLDGASVPLLGVNLGALGYLTEVEADHVDEALDRFAAGADAGHWHLDERMMLDVTVNGRHVGRALNEAVIEKGLTGHTVRLLARIDGEPFTHYNADGLIVATPTGSTAYSLSARGPIVSPRHRAILLTPVSPHMLFDRSLVLDPTEVIDIEVSGHRHAQVAIDGQPVGALDDGDVVRVVPAAETASFVRFGTYHYHQILKAKFGLTDRSSE